MTTTSCYARAAFEHALSVIGHPGTHATDRYLAARVVELLGRHMTLDERLLTDVARTVDRALADVTVVNLLLCLLRLRCTDRDKLAPWLSRLAHRAHRDGPRSSLFPIVGVAVREPAWLAVLRDSHVHEGLAHALDRGQLVTAVDIILSWTAAHERMPGWMRGVVRQRPGLLSACSPETVWRLHVALPTVASWRDLAVSGADAAVDREAFGPAVDEATKTLSEAIEQEADNGVRVVLASWLTKLTE